MTHAEWEEILRPGRRFRTLFEDSCTVLSSVNLENGSFLGIDSDGIECEYFDGMVQEVWDA